MASLHVEIDEANSMMALDKPAKVLSWLPLALRCVEINVDGGLSVSNKGVGFV